MNRRISACLLAFFLLVTACAKAQTGYIIYTPSSDGNGVEIKTHPTDSGSFSDNIESLIRDCLDSFGKAAPGLTGIEYTPDHITVNLITVSPLTETETALTEFCLYRTLTQDACVKTVNILIDGSCALYGDVPLVSLPAESNVSDLGEFLLLASANTTQTVYLPDTASDLVYPKTVTLNGCGQIEKQLINAVIPECKAEYEYGFTADGHRLLSISLNEIPDRFSVGILRLYACLTLTLCSNIPGLTYVALTIEGENLKSPGGSFPACRSDFVPYLGYCCPYGGKVIPMADSVSPETLISECCKYPLSAGDILSVDFVGSTAYLNFSYDLYAQCQKTDSRGEKEFVFELVNLVAGAYGCENAIILIEGRTAETLAGNIRLDVPLYPDYGQQR